MSVRHTAAATLCVAALIHSSAHAADATDLQQMQQQIDQLKQSYESRIQALEAQLRALQQRSAAAGAAPPAAAPATATAAPAGTAGTAPAAATAAVPAAAAAEPAQAPPATTATSPALPAPAATAQASASAFNPAISLILAGTYANLSHDPADYRLQGFMPSGGEVGPGPRGFSLGESELSIAREHRPDVLRPADRGDHRATTSIERRGGAVRTPGDLVDGATLRGGRFLSAIGYLNAQHAHTWDFVDAPLAYQAFFGGQIKTDGVQLRWLAPTDRFIELGAEIGAGPQLPGQRQPGRNGIGSTALFAHVGDDIGDSASWRVGLSYLLQPRRRPPLRRRQRRRHAGDQRVQRQQPHLGRRRHLQVGAGRQRDADQLQAAGRVLPAHARAARLAYDIARRGRRRERQLPLGAERLVPAGRLPVHAARGASGLRYDRLDSGSPHIGLVGERRARARPTSRSCSAPGRRAAPLMVDYSPSEFSRFRLQLAADRSDPTAHRPPDLPAVHHEPRRPRCARVLGLDAMKHPCNLVAPSLLGAWPPASACARRPRSTSSPASPNGRRSRKELGGDKVNVSVATTAHAGPASDRGAAEPDRAHAQRRPARLHRHRARDRLAAGAAAAVGQRQARAGRAGQLRGRPLRHAARGADAARPQRGRRARRRQPAHPARPAQHRAGRRPRSARGWRSSTRRNAAHYQQRLADVLAALERGDRASWEQQARRCKGMAVVAHHKNFDYLWNWLGMREVGDARAQARRRAERSAT